MSDRSVRVRPRLLIGVVPPARCEARRVAHGTSRQPLLALPLVMATAATVNGNLPNPSPNGWTGGRLTIASLDDQLCVLSTPVTGVMGVHRSRRSSG